MKRLIYFFSVVILISIVINILLTSCERQPIAPQEDSSSTTVDSFRNRFIGTWVSCCWTPNQNNDPTDDCVYTSSCDTLIFTDSTFVFKEGQNTYNFGYEYSDNYMVFFRENLGYHRPNFVTRYQFKNADSIMVFYGWEYPAFQAIEGVFYNLSFKKIH